MKILISVESNVTFCQVISTLWEDYEIEEFHDYRCESPTILIKGLKGEDK